MPAPLPPLKPKLEVQRLSFLPSPKIKDLPSANGVPTVAWIIQLSSEFDPVLGDGHWKLTQYPTNIEFDDYDQFRRVAARHLPVQSYEFEELMDYLHNFKCLNIDLRTGEYYPVIPLPRGFNVTLPVPGAPGPYLGGGGG